MRCLINCIFVIAHILVAISTFLIGLLVSIPLHLFTLLLLKKLEEEPARMTKQADAAKRDSET